MCFSEYTLHFISLCFSVVINFLPGSYSYYSVVVFDVVFVSVFTVNENLYFQLTEVVVFVNKNNIGRARDRPRWPIVMNWRPDVQFLWRHHDHVFAFTRLRWRHRQSAFTLRDRKTKRSEVSNDIYSSPSAGLISRPMWPFSDLSACFSFCHFSFLVIIVMSCVWLSWLLSAFDCMYHVILWWFALSVQHNIVWVVFCSLVSSIVCDEQRFTW